MEMTPMTIEEAFAVFEEQPTEETIEYTTLSTDEAKEIIESE